MKKNNIIYLNGLIDLAQSRLGSKLFIKLTNFLLQRKELLILGHQYLKKEFLISMVNGWMDGRQEEKELKDTIF